MPEDGNSGCLIARRDKSPHPSKRSPPSLTSAGHKPASAQVALASRHLDAGSGRNPGMTETADRTGNPLFRLDDGHGARWNQRVFEARTMRLASSTYLSFRTSMIEIYIAAERSWWQGADIPLWQKLLFGATAVALYIGLQVWFSISARKKNRETAGRIEQIGNRNPYITESGVDRAALDALEGTERKVAVKQLLQDLKALDGLMGGWERGMVKHSILSSPDSPMVKEREALAKLIEEFGSESAGLPEEDEFATGVDASRDSESA